MRVTSYQSEIGKSVIMPVVASVFGRLVGSCIVKVSGVELADDAVLVHNLTVNPAFRRKGVATRLLRTAVKVAEKMGKGRVVLYSNKENTTSMNLYKKLGFLNMGDKGDNFIMSLELKRTNR